MKLALTRELFCPDERWPTTFREVSVGTIGEPVDIIVDDDCRVSKFKMIFYGIPGVHEILTKDLARV